MKNTKSLLSTGVILAIALFTSIQGASIERAINPHLTQENVAKIQKYIKDINSFMPDLNTIKDQDMRDSLLRNGKQLLINCDKVLYNNQPVPQNVLDLLQQQEQTWMRMLIVAFQY